uniref:ARAD1D50952p n=1 Tax=Blastobotrys adeninivorans TaxID=409370 RepID=A0A060TJY8_BLAAD
MTSKVGDEGASGDDQERGQNPLLKFLWYFSDSTWKRGGISPTCLLSNCQFSLSIFIPQGKMVVENELISLQTNLPLLTHLLTPLENGYLVGMPNVAFLSERWRQDFNYPAGHRLNLLSSALGLGMFCGFILLALVSRNTKQQKRHSILVLGNMAIIFGAIIQSMSFNFWHFFIARVSCGLGIYLASTTSNSIVEESFADSSDFITTLYNGMSLIGVILGNCVTFSSESSLNWRVPSALQAILPIVQLLLHFQFPSNLDSTPINHDSCHRSPSEFGLKSLLRRKSCHWYILSAAIVPCICVHFGNGILLTTFTEILEITYGLNNSHQQVLINGALLIYNVVSATLKASRGDISRLPLTIFNLVATGILATAFFRAGLATKFMTDDFAPSSVIMIVLACCAYNLLSGIPVSHLSDRAPKHFESASTIIGLSTNLTTLYNGFVNPWSMSQTVWVKYVLTVGAGLFHVGLFTAITLSYRTGKHFHFIENLHLLKSSI